LRILVTSIVDLKKSQHNRPHQLVRYLSRKHDVTVLSVNDWWKGRQDNLEAYSREFDDIFKNVDYFYLTDNEVSPILQELLFWHRVRSLVRDYDFDAHLNYSTLLSGYQASKILKTVYDIADDLIAMIRESPQIPRPLRPFGGFLGKVMVNKNIQRAERVTVTTETLKRKHRIPDGKCAVVPNGVDTSLFRDHGDSCRDMLKLDGFVIGYVGVLREWVDLEPVFNALSKLNQDIKMVVVGREGRFNENIALAKDCGVADRVIFTGMVPYSQVPRCISAMDVCLIPFKRGAISKSALPLKLFEYMACERPVISTRLPGIEAVAGDRVLYAESVEQYKEKILYLYENERFRRAMGSTGRAFVEKNYDWAKIAGMIERLLIEVGDVA